VECTRLLIKYDTVFPAKAIKNNAKRAQLLLSLEMNASPPLPPDPVADISIASPYLSHIDGKD
jgi:hypothetical protein